jgi:hypothetical protein
VTAAASRQTAAGFALVAVFMTSAIAMERVRDGRYTVATIDDRSLYLTSGAALGRLSLGFKALAADLYWIRTLQYYGDIQRGHRGRAPLEPEAAAREYDSLYPLLDLTTSLDPRFNLAYRFGAVFLSEKPPAGPGRPDLAIELLEKGLAVRPDRWEYMLDIGFVHYWWDHDYIQAAEAFRKAGEMPGAPVWLKPLAATTLVEGGDRKTSRTIFTALAQTAEIDWLKRGAERRLLQLDALDAIDRLQAGIDRYATLTRSTPSGWPALLRDGAIPGVPLDPTGAPYELTSSGKVRLSNRSSLWPLPDEPQALKRPAP